jgi:hypothetical protein
MIRPGSQPTTPTVPVFGPKRTTVVTGPGRTVPLADPQPTVQSYSPPAIVAPLPTAPETRAEVPRAQIESSAWRMPTAEVHASVWRTPRAGIGSSEWAVPRAEVARSAWTTPQAEIETRPGFAPGTDAPEPTTLLSHILGFARDPKSYSQNLVRQGPGAEPLTLLDHINGLAFSPGFGLGSLIGSGG